MDELSGKTTKNTTPSISR